MNPRDPRLDPRPGDRFRKGESAVTITRATTGTLAFTFSGKLSKAPPMVPWHKPWLPVFRRWAKDAEVVEQAAGEAAGGDR
jgi:hypothetical protein